MNAFVNSLVLKGPIWRFPATICGFMFLFFAIPLARHNFDISNFIHAGDRFVDAAQVPAPIKVLDHSNGYDGQFYYRLAIAPDAHALKEFGVTFDGPAWRMQRIGYPVLVYLASGGRADLVPTMLVLVNFAGIAVIVFFSQQLRQQLNLPAWFPIAIAAWPGFFITLVCDTTEITALAFMMAAISAFLARRYWLYAMLAAASTLTRETSIMIFGGVFAYTGLMLVVERGDWTALAKNFWRTVYCLLALLPFLAWRWEMRVRWGNSLMQATARQIGWPLVGVTRD